MAPYGEAGGRLLPETQGIGLFGNNQCLFAEFLLHGNHKSLEDGTYGWAGQGTEGYLVKGEQLIGSLPTRHRALGLIPSTL